MKIDLISQNCNSYKANLHSHSTLSDGWLTPAELKNAYKARGYSILSITDHELLHTHEYLDDPDFITISGYETGIVKEPTPDFPYKKVCHLNLYSKKQTGNKIVCYRPESVLKNLNGKTLSEIEYFGTAEKAVYTPAYINHVIEEALQHDYIVSYNHPHWSLESFADFSQYRGMFAMEVYNNSCNTLGIPEWNEQSWEWLMRSGTKISVLSCDDNHNKHDFSHPLCDSFGGWTMIQSPSLSYQDIITALECGNFYATTNPEIYEIYLEDNVLHIACSDAKDIIVNSLGRTSRHAKADHGKFLNNASFEIQENFGYVRVRIIDENGKMALSQAYWLKDFSENTKENRTTT